MTKVHIEVEFLTKEHGLTRGWVSGVVRSELGGMLALDSIQILNCRTKIEDL